MAHFYRLVCCVLLFGTCSFSFAEVISATSDTQPLRKMYRSTQSSVLRYFDGLLAACQHGAVDYGAGTTVTSTTDAAVGGVARCFTSGGGTPYGGWSFGIDVINSCVLSGTTGPSCVQYSCPSGQSWTLSGSQCTRPNCDAGETRNASGVCVGPCTAGQSVASSVDTGWHTKGDLVSRFQADRDNTPTCGASATSGGQGCAIGNVSRRAPTICVPGSNGFERCTAFYNGSTTGGSCTLPSPPAEAPEPPCAGQKGLVNGVMVCLKPESQRDKDNRAAAAADLAAQVAANAAALAGKSAVAQAAAAKAAGAAAAAASQAGANSAEAAAAGASAGSAAANSASPGSSSSMNEGTAAGAGAAAGARAAAISAAAGLNPTQTAEAVAAATSAATAAANAAINNGATSASVANAATVAGQAATASIINGASAAAAGAAAAAAGAGAQAGTAAGTGGAGNTAPGSGGGAPQSSTPVDDFCARNPAAAMCKNEMDGEFSGACGTPPVCKGDAIMCAVAASTFQTNCAITTGPSTDSPLVAAYKVEAAKNQGDQTSGSTDTVNVGPSSFDQTNILGAAVGVSDLSVTIMGRPLVLPFSDLNIWFERLGLILRAITLLICARILIRG